MNFKAYRFSTCHACNQVVLTIKLKIDATQVIRFILNFGFWYYRKLAATCCSDCVVFVCDDILHKI